MSHKLKFDAAEGSQEFFITREFDFPVELLFKAHVDSEMIVQWKMMPNTTAKVTGGIKKHGGYQLEATNAEGNVIFRNHGVVHELIENEKMIRTFEVENAPFGVQFEIYDFEKLTDNTSKLKMHVIFESNALRDDVLTKMPADSLERVYNKLDELAKNLK